MGSPQIFKLKWTIHSWDNVTFGRYNYTHLNFILIGLPNKWKIRTDFVRNISLFPQHPRVTLDVEDEVDSCYDDFYKISAFAKSDRGPCFPVRKRANPVILPTIDTSGYFHVFAIAKKEEQRQHDQLKYAVHKRGGI